MKAPRRPRFVCHQACSLAIAALVLINAACSGQAPTTSGDSAKPTQEKASAGSLGPLHPLDEASSAKLRSAFDEAKDRTRFIVALSPT
jgi:hypothetical protein